LKKNLLPLAALVACYLLLFASVGGSYGHLPDRVASHFDLHGQPNGWMTRTTILEAILGLGILLPAFTVGIMITTGKIPVSFVRLPHRDYWLAPERQRETLASLFPYALWLACINVLFVTGLLALIIQANANSAQPHVSLVSVASLIGGFVLATFIWALLLKRKFAREP